MVRLSWVALGALTACHPVSGAGARPKAVEWPAPGSWLAEQTPRCGAVVGRVTFWPSGAGTTPRPPPGALVQTGDTSRADLTRQTAAGTAASTDVKGEFRLRLPEDRRVSLVKIRAIGLAPVVVAIDGERYRAA